MKEEKVGSVYTHPRVFTHIIIIIILKVIIIAMPPLAVAACIPLLP